MINKTFSQIAQSQQTIMAKVGLVVILSLFIIAQIVTSIDTPEKEAKCLSCIRNVSSSLSVSDVTKRCEGYYCGPYQLSYTYWAEAGKPGNNQGSRDYEKCARDKNCAEQTVRAYFKKFKRDCNKDGLIDCQDMAALHKGGPTSCSSDWFYKSRYWLAFNKTSCMTGQSDDQSSSDRQKLDFDRENSNLKHPDGLVKNQSLTTECLDCICEAVTGCNTSANNCGSGAVCGPFAISQAYWKDGRKPGASWTACARTKECSSVTVKNYMEKYKRDCNDDGYITCEDYAAIHRRGPRACSNKDLLKDHYWNKFLACRANQKPAKDVNMVKVSDDTANINLLASRGDTNLLQLSTSGSGSSTMQPQFIDKGNINHISGSDTGAVHNIRKTTSTSNSVAIGSSSGNGSSTKGLPQITQTTLKPLTTSGKFDYAQTPTYELTSVVLNIKDDKDTSKTDTSTQPDAIRNHIVQQQQQHQHNHDQEHYGNNDDHHRHHHHHHQPSQHGFHSQNEQLDLRQHGTPEAAVITKLEPDSTSDYRPLQPVMSSPSYELSVQSKPVADYELTMSLASNTPSDITADNSGIGSSGTSWMAAEIPSTTTLPPSQILTTTATGTFANSGTSNAAFIPIETNPVHSASISNRRNYNENDLHPPTTNQNVEQQPSQTSQKQPPITMAPNFSPVDQPMAHPIAGEEIDYSVSDFSFPAQASAAERANNFDKVVTGIVGSPDFSKSYPPVPEIIVSDKQEAEQQQAAMIDEELQQQQQLSKQTNHHQQLTVNTNHSRNPNNNQASSKSSLAQLQIMETPQRVHTRIATNSGGDGSQTPDADQQGTSSSTIQLQRSALPAGNQQEKDLKAQQSATPLRPLADAGVDSLNMSSLFENGSLNESSKISSECLECICDASSNCDTTVQCISKQREKNRCGLYMISWNQYQESDISLTPLIPIPAGLSEELADEKLYYECTTNRSCAEKLIYLYIEKHQRDCNNDGKIDCYDIAAIHRVGPENCNSGKFLGSQYWKDFNICYAADRITTTSTTIKLTQ